MFFYPIADLRCHRVLVAIVLTGGLGACSAPLAPTGIHDPYEVQNREMHGFNVAVDSALVSPLAQATDTIIPAPVLAGLSNISDTLDLPGEVANNLLQGRIPNALQNTLRFAVNATLGLGGLFDPASDMGVPAKHTDFGETLHLWGVGEGAYVVLPLLGPSTSRDAVGTVVDILANPINLLLTGQDRQVATGIKIISKLGDRGRYSNTVDSILHESADSYAQTRLLYLQNRRFNLGQEASEDDFFDPYEDQ